MSRITSLVLLSFVACSGANTQSDDPDKTTTTDALAVCGNEVRDGDEPCDGPDLGDQTCADVPGFVNGTLACADDCTLDATACMADVAGAVVRFNEVTSEAIADGPYAGAGDAIELYNAGMAVADLSGMQISDEADFPVDKSYVFPAGTMLAPGEFRVLVKIDEVTGMGDYGFGISSSNPETLRLGDASGMVLDSVDFAGPDASISWCRVPDGDGTWQLCARTFGESNMVGAADDTTAGTPTCGDGLRDGDEVCDGDDLGGLACADVLRGQNGTLACDANCELDTTDCSTATGSEIVVLNEIISIDTDDIELYNPGARAVDLGGWTLTDDLAAPDDPYDPKTDLERLVFADGTMIGAGEWLVIPAGDPPGHLFGLSGDGDTVTLLDGELAVVDFVAYGLDEAAVSYCRIPDGPEGEWQAGCTATPGDSNEP